MLAVREHAVVQETVNSRLAATRTPSARALGTRRRPRRAESRDEEPRHEEAHGPGLRYLPALDGLRALAVIAVLLYHGGVSFLPGGFLGVDVFFVLSGYLITCLLLEDWRRYGTIRLRHFWLRRARRLLPALFVLLAVVGVVAVLFLPDDVASFRGQFLAAIGYVENWYLILHHDSYFVALGRAPLLRHVWSLAVEEQFYLVWPLVLGAVLRRWGTKHHRVLMGIVCAVLASTVLMAVMYQPFTDPSREYFGTDTRAAPLLVGAALAFVWAPWRLSRQVGRFATVFLDLGAALAVLGLFVCCASFGQYDPGLYRGGFLLVAALTAVALAATVHPAARLSTWALSRRWLVWIGVRSYGIYLWHWPLFMVTRPHADLPFDGLPLLLVRLGLTGLVAAASYHYVELPVRNGALGRWWGRFGISEGEERIRLARRATAFGTTGALVALVLVVGFAAAKPPPLPAFAAEGPAKIAITTTTVGVTPTSAPQGKVTAVGASVMLSARYALGDLLGARLELDAAVSRQASGGIAVLRQLHDAGQLGSTVVVQLGDNGTYSDEQFDETMQLLAGVPHVLMLTVKVDRPWEDQVNELLATRTHAYPNVQVVDWHASSIDHPDWFVADGIHLTDEGARQYAALINSYLTG